MDEKDYVSFDTALKLKKAGFSYKKPVARCTMPSLYQAQKWLREVKNIDVLVWNCACGYGWEISKSGDEQTMGTTLLMFDGEGEDEDSGKWLSYEAALQDGINKALKLINK